MCNYALTNGNARHIMKVQLETHVALVRETDLFHCQETDRFFCFKDIEGTPVT